MKKRARSLLKVIFGRTILVMLLVTIQFAILLGTFFALSTYIGYLYNGFTIIGVVVTIYILNTDINPNFKLAWIMPIVAFPVVGALFYLYFKFQIGNRVVSRKLTVLIQESKKDLIQDEDVMEALKWTDIGEYHLATYLNRFVGFPVYDDSSVKYFPSGESKLDELLIQLEQAKKFIFLEYFIIEEGIMWDSILDILVEKVNEGVEVRVMYDGMCSIALLPYYYPKQLEKLGIKAKMFSPIRPALSSSQNNRDHRKILVIDGHTAFTGGINLADEYINEHVRFGHWKDTAVMIKGEAVKSFTLMFLQMWNIDEKVIMPCEPYVQKEFVVEADKKSLGFIIPYGDSPLDQESVGQTVYMDIINRAQQYVHITTPYLILDNELSSALKYAAKRGVEVIIIMPHIPDKKYAYLLARTYYMELLLVGVQIYEYKPGFMHGKNFVSDGSRGVVGSINLDYRSLYHHFECALYMYKNIAIKEIEADFQDTLKKCIPITISDCKNYNIVKKIAGRILRLIAPLM